MAGITSEIRKLKRDERGTSMLEFALLSPFLVVLVLGIGDFGMGFSQRYSMQQAASRALESAHLGDSTTNYDYLRAEAASAAGVPVDDVILAQWLECDGVKRTTGTCTATQQTSRYLQLTINSSFDPAFAMFHSGNLSPDGTIALSVDASVRVQ